jgi:hypothetical protein
VECGRRVRGLAWGDRCAECQIRRRRRANRLASRISLGATVLMAAYVAFLRPTGPTAQFYAVVGVLAVYIIVRRIAARLAMEFLPAESAGSTPENPTS